MILILVKIDLQKLIRLPAAEACSKEARTCHGKVFWQLHECWHFFTYPAYQIKSNQIKSNQIKSSKMSILVKQPASQLLDHSVCHAQY
jgi:hypothetical protein